MQLFFYELHEGATDLMTDAILVSERDHTPAEFEAVVQAARSAVIDTFEEDTLVEAIARELERSHGFTYASDEKLRSSMPARWPRRESGGSCARRERTTSCATGKSSRSSSMSGAEQSP